MCITSHSKDWTHISRLWITTVRDLIEVIYLGLSVLKLVIRKSPGMIMTYRERIMGCFGSRDLTIRKQALRLLESLATENNVGEIVKLILSH